MAKPYTPRPYQELITNFLIDTPRCNVWAGMGMGKSLSTLTALEDLFMAGAETQPALVLAPLRVAASTWPDEAVKWGHLRNIEVQPIVGNAKARAAALANSNASVFTINYDNLVWLVEELGGRWPFGTVIPDESTRLKSFRLRGGGKRAAALGKVAHKHVRRWMNLTGTPAPNGLVDLWGQAWFVDQGQRLGRTYGAFTSRWFNSIQFPGQSWTKLEPFAHSQDEIQRALADVTISLDAADWFDIQEPIHNVIRVEMPPKARQQYREMEKEMFLELNGEGIEAPNAAAKTVKCLQMCVAGDSEILTSNGWKQIRDVTIGDQIWDGIEYVSHRGVISRGVRPVVNCWGARMTPDHEVLTDAGWKKAEEVINAQSRKRLNRSDFRLPDGYSPSWQHENQVQTRNMACEMYLRKRIYSHRNESHESETISTEVLRMQKGGNADKDSRISRNDIPSRVEYLGTDASTLWKSAKQRLEELWRQGDNGLRSLAILIQKLYGRYGPILVPGLKSGSHRQFEGVLPGELSLGHPATAKQKPANKYTYRNPGGCYDCNRSSGGIRVKHGHTSCESIQVRVPAGESLISAGTEEVFDIMNAGPRNRFVMRGTSAPFISHNCNGAVYTDDTGSWSELHDTKLQALDSILTEAAGAPVLVAYHWKHDLERLHKAFPRGRHPDQNPQTLRDWNAGKIPVLFAHPASAGHGLNMQDGGNILVFFSHWWDLEQYQQIIERIGPTRQIQAGHNRPVFIHHIIAADTMDEMVMERRNSKRTVQDILLDAMKKRGVL